MQGVNIKYENRTNIITWRIGALYQGLLKRYVNDCDQLVIFNPGFQPRNDFLMKTIPYLTENNHLGMVQARWTSGKTKKTSFMIIIINTKPNKNLFILPSWWLACALAPGDFT